LTNVPSGAYAKKTILRVIILCWATYSQESRLMSG